MQFDQYNMVECMTINIHFILISKIEKKIGNSLFIYDYSYYYTINDHIVIQYDQILHKIIH